MDERELFTQYRESKEGPERVALRNKIVEQYLYVAQMISKKFVGRGVEYDDLLQVASLALMKGVERFDPDVGVKFSTFITPTITGEIKNYFRDSSRLVHLPRRVAELRSRVRAAADTYLANEGRSPTPHELAHILGVPEEDVISSMEAGSVVSLDRPVDEESEDGSFYDMLPDKEDDFEELEQADIASSALAILSNTERELINYRFGQELSQTETAKRMNVSQMYVSRMERKILEKLRENLKKSLAE